MRCLFSLCSVYLKVSCLNFLKLNSSNFKFTLKENQGVWQLQNLWHQSFFQLSLCRKVLVHLCNRSLATRLTRRIFLIRHNLNIMSYYYACFRVPLDWRTLRIPSSQLFTNTCFLEFINSHILEYSVICERCKYKPFIFAEILLSETIYLEKFPCCSTNQSSVFDFRLRRQIFW